MPHLHIAVTSYHHVVVHTPGDRVGLCVLDTAIATCAAVQSMYVRACVCIYVRVHACLHVHARVCRVYVRATETEHKRVYVASNTGIESK